MLRKNKTSNPRKARVRDAIDSLAASYDEFPEFSKEYWYNCRRGTYWLAVENRFFTIGPKERQEAREGRLIMSISPEVAVRRNPKANYVIQYSADPYLEIKKIQGREGHVRILNADLIKKIRVLGKTQAIKETYPYQKRYMPSCDEELYEVWKAAHEAKEKKKAKTGRARKKKIKIRR